MLTMNRSRLDRNAAAETTSRVRPGCCDRGEHYGPDQRGEVAQDRVLAFMLVGALLDEFGESRDGGPHGRAVRGTDRAVGLRAADLHGECGVGATLLRGVAVGARQVLLDERGARRDGIAVVLVVQLPDPVGALGEGRLDRRRGEGVLRREVPVEAAVGEPGLGHHLGYADSGDAAGAEEPGRGVDDLVVVARGVDARGARHATTIDDAHHLKKSCAPGGKSAAIRSS